MPIPFTTNQRSRMSSPRSLLPLLLAVLVYALPSSAANAQEATTLPQIRLVNHRGVFISNMYLCAGADWVACKDNTTAKMDAEMFYSYPERDNLGGRKVSEWETIDLGGVASFALFTLEGGGFGPPSWFMQLVDVHPGTAVPVTAPLTGTLRATGALAALNGLAVTQGETLFGVAPPIPPVVDFDVHMYESSSPAVAFSVSRSRY